VPLEADEARVYTLALDLDDATLRELEHELSADERARAARFLFEGHRRRFVAAHGQLRRILAGELGGAARELRFDTGPHGKPFLVDGGDLRFNLSHSADVALVALARGRELGVDVEEIAADRVTDGLAAFSFSPRELADFRALSGDAQVAGFFACWSRKEAFIKALGTGLALPLDSFDVTLAPDEPPRLRATRFDPAEAQRWTLLALSPPRGFAGALVIEGAAPRLRCLELPPRRTAESNDTMPREGAT
jgi:4'-phosphopantetheinyl transferase